MSTSIRRCGPGPAASCSRTPGRPTSSRPSRSSPPARPSSRRAMRHLIEAFARRPDDQPPPDLGALRERELEVLRAVAKGWSNVEIAASLYVSPATVKTHISRLLMKLAAATGPNSSSSSRDGPRRSPTEAAVVRDGRWVWGRSRGIMNARRCCKVGVAVLLVLTAAACGDDDDDAADGTGADTGVATAGPTTERGRDDRGGSARRRSPPRRLARRRRQRRRRPVSPSSSAC